MQQFVQDNVHIIQDLSSSKNIDSIASELKSTKNFVDFARLSQEKENVYKFLNQCTEFDDNDIANAMQYLMGFVASEKPWNLQANIVQVMLDYMCNLVAAHQIIK